jgi:type I restriction enzyme S subunit
MIEEWEKLKLKDICEFKYGKNLPETKRIQGNFPVYGSSGIISYHKTYLIGGPGIIVGRKGTVGKVQFSKGHFFPIDTTFYIEENKSKVDLKFLYYLLPLCGLDTMNSDAAVPGLNRNAAINQKIYLPPLNVQQKIAKTLSFYDGLIENNLQRIKLLEDLAQNTFNEFYSNNKEFEEVNLGSFIGHEIGGGWGNDELTDEFKNPAYVIRGTDIDELPNGKLEKVPFRYHKKSNLASRKLQDGDIIFEVSGGSSYEGVAKTLLVTEELLKQFDNAVMPASFCKLARPAKREYSSFLFLFLRFLRNIRGTEVFEIRSASNIVNYNWTAFLKFQKVKKPDDDDLEKFNAIVEPIYKQIYILGNQNQYLKEARDILLPRLMTGMIDVSKIDSEL